MKTLLMIFGILLSSSSFAKVCHIDVSYNVHKNMFIFDLQDADEVGEVDELVIGLIDHPGTRPCWDIMEQYNGIQLHTVLNGYLTEVILRHTPVKASNDCTVLVQPNDMALGQIKSADGVRKIDEALFKLGYRTVRSSEAKTDYTVRSDGIILAKPTSCSEAQEKTVIDIESRLRFFSKSGAEITTTYGRELSETSCGAASAEYFEVRETTLLKVYLEALKTLPVCEKAD